MKNGMLLVLLASVMMFSCDSATNVSPELIQDEAVIQDQFPTQIELTDEERMILNEVGFFAKHGVRGVTYSRSKVRTVPDGPAVGRSILARYDGGIYMLSLSVLNDFIGHAITQWLFIFNAPENCSDNVCGLNDLGNSEARVVRLGGAMVVRPVLRRRFWSDSWFFARLHEDDDLEISRNAVVLSVLRTHGRAIDGAPLPTTPGEGCNPECTNIQFSTHTTVSEWHAATDFICPFGPDDCPIIAQAANGHTIEIRQDNGPGGFAAGGTLSVHPESVDGSGTFVHKDASGVELASGAWMATELLSYKDRGRSPVFCGPDFPSPAFCAAHAGRALIRIHLVPVSGPDFNGIFRVTCVLPGVKVPASWKEGATLSVEGGLNFGMELSGATVFLE